MSTESERALYSTTQLEQELKGIEEIIEEQEVSHTNIRQILSKCSEISSIAQEASFKDGDVGKWLDIFLRAERTIIKLLPQFGYLLPSEDLINQIVETTAQEEGHTLLTSLLEKFPFAIRTTHNPHLYLPLLKQVEKVYGQSSHPVEQDVRHEWGHFGRYLAQANSFNYEPETKEETKLCIIFNVTKEGYLGVQPFIEQDQSRLTWAERKEVAWNDEELGDMSDGDRAQKKFLEENSEE